ncbi:MAG: KAP family NTPase [Muribaculaceae bacterium]|nr:KAP family NTPase [Muribaculaceae bacterium]MCM1505365.1 KAP family NTPase [Muribaculum sp.]
MNFVIDRPINNESDDELDYHDPAKLLANSIRASSINESFSIAVVAPWGAGKSSFINLMVGYLPEASIEVVRFNPRHARSVQSIQEDFFETLKSELSVYDGEFTSTIHKYLESISMFDGNFFSNIIMEVESAIDCGNPKETLTKIISRHWDRVVIVMEDFDRLTSEELIEVLKLIDNNAAIDRLVFVCAFDRNHINEVLQERGPGFIDKYFDVEYPIPARPYTAIFKYIESRLLQRVFGEDNDRARDAILSCSQVLLKHVPTFREAKRLVNHIEIAYEYVKGDVEITDYILVTVMKLFAHADYRILCDSNFISEWNSATNDNAKELLKQFKTSGDVISKLVNRNKTERSFNNPDSYYIYIWNDVYGKLRYKNLLELMEPSKPFENNYSLYLSSKSGPQILEFLQFRSRETFNSFETLKRFIELITYPFVWNPTGDYNPGLYMLILKMLSKETANECCKNCSITIDEYKQIFTTILSRQQDKNTPVSLCRALVYSSLTESARSIVLRHNEIFKINCQNLESYTQDNPDYTHVHYLMLLCCMERIDEKTDVVFLDSTSCLKVRKLIEKSPSIYFETFVRQARVSSSIYHFHIGCEGFWRQIFGSPEYLEKIIDSLPDKLLVVKNFWVLYKANNYEPIPYENDGTYNEKINNALSDEVKRYDILLHLRYDYVDLLEQKDDGRITIGIFNAKVQEIKDRMQNEVKLDIREAHSFMLALNRAQ